MGGVIVLRENKVAIVHDSFAHYQEGQQVIEEIAGMLPGADIFSAFSSGVTAQVRSRILRTNWMQSMPAGDKLRGGYVLLYPFAIKALDLSRYEMVISNCAGFARGVEYRDSALHICYCHSPTRAVLDHTDDVSAQDVKGATRLLLRPLLAGLRGLGSNSSIQPDYYIAKSRAVAHHIQQDYGRNALVIHPPIDTSRYHPSSHVGDYLLIVSSLVSLRHIEMAIVACNSSNRQLVIVGDGPASKQLEALAGPTVHLLGWRTESEIADLLARCLAVFCSDAEKGFDTMPLKANAAGRPAISFAADSAFETIADGETGVLCWEYSRPAMVDAIERCSRLEWNPAVLRAHARSFDASAFRSRFAALLADICGEKFSAGVPA
jgi:glycosyltransferase involved in cell wall biosynthesis